MKETYEKHELTIAIILIVIYSIGQSFATTVNGLIGIDYSANAIFNILLTVGLLVFIKAKGLTKRYGLCRPTATASAFLFFIPLIIISSGNLWNGVGINFPLTEMICYITYMLCVGFVEEILFRGMLFKALAKDNVKLAIVISSVTFGLGHIINLINGVSSDIIESVSQIIGAISLGFLFVVIMYRGGSILPCIITHSAIDVASAFANMDGFTPQKRMIFCLVKLVITVAYTVILTKTLPKAENGVMQTKVEQA